MECLIGKILIDFCMRTIIYIWFTVSTQSVISGTNLDKMRKYKTMI